MKPRRSKSQSSARWITSKHRKGNCMSDTKSDVLRLRITPELKRQLQAAAAKENRSLTNYVETALKRALAQKKKQ